MLPTNTPTTPTPAPTYKSPSLYKEPRERIALLSSNFIRRYPVFLDRDIGIANKYHHLTISNKEDEDCDSTEDVIEMGLKYGLHILKGIDEDEWSQDMDSRSTVKPRGQLKLK